MKETIQHLKGGEILKLLALKHDLRIRDIYFFSTLFLKNTNFAALATITISQTYVSLNAIVVYLCPDLHFVQNAFCILYLCPDLQRKLT